MRCKAMGILGFSRWGRKQPRCSFLFGRMSSPSTSPSPCPSLSPSPSPLSLSHCPFLLCLLSLFLGLPPSLLPSLPPYLSLSLSLSLSSLNKTSIWPLMLMPAQSRVAKMQEKFGAPSFSIQTATRSANDNPLLAMCTWGSYIDRLGVQQTPLNWNLMENGPGTMYAGVTSFLAIFC